MPKSVLDIINIRQTLNKAALAIIRKVKARTRKGVSVQGTPFKPYNPQYAKKRKKKGLPVDKVDLVFDEHFGMMTTIDHVINNSLHQAEIFFNNPNKEKLAYYHHVSGAGKSRVIRKFFALNKAESTEIADLVDNDISDQLLKFTADEIEQMFKDLEGPK